MKTLKQLTLPTIKVITLLAGLMTILACQAETSQDISSALALDDSKYTILSKKIPTSSGDKVEVAELFTYGCGHCFKLESSIVEWQDTMPDTAEFVKVPAVFSAAWDFHAKAYYTMQSLGVLEQANQAFFNRLHLERKPISTLPAFIDFMQAYGKSAEEVTNVFNSFEIDNKVRNAKTISIKSTASGVPAVIVGGKYLTSVSQAGSQKAMFDTIDQLIKKIAAEK